MFASTRGETSLQCAHAPPASSGTATSRPLEIMTGVAFAHPRLKRTTNDDHPGSGATNPRAGAAPLMCTNAQSLSRYTAPAFTAGKLGAGSAKRTEPARRARKIGSRTGKERSARVRRVRRSRKKRKARGLPASLMQEILVPSITGPSPVLESRPRPGREPDAPSNGACGTHLRTIGRKDQALLSRGDRAALTAAHDRGKRRTPRLPDSRRPGTRTASNRSQVNARPPRGRPRASGAARPDPST